MIGKCTPEDLVEIYEIINDGATAYKGMIPEDCYHDPYMSLPDLKKQINEGVQFWCYKEGFNILGVMGIQDKTDVTLIRHAYVRTQERNKGIGKKLLKHLMSITPKPILIGTWKDATWAIAFYEKNGFKLLSEEKKNDLLSKYWTIPKRQMETSVVLADNKGSVFK